VRPFASRRWPSLVAFVLVAGAYGRASAAIPAPSDPSLFWIGNLCAPWLVLSFLAGRAQRSLPLAVLAGALTDIACVVGFYFTFLSLDPSRFGLADATPLATVALTSLGDWLRFTAQWLLAAVAGGALYGALGLLWRRAHLLAAGLALALPFVAEPVLWIVREGRYEGPWPIWAVEVVVGLGVAAFAVARAGGAAQPRT
jgi:hypothetical protein